MKLAGLETIRGGTPRARRAALLRCDDVELGERVRAMADALRTGTTNRERAALARAAGLPLGDVVASPFGLRMVAMAVRLGATTVHQELRAPLPLTRTGARATIDPRHGTWAGGVLHEGKYQQFGLEDPFAVFHPDHTSKWGPHEALHRAVGFFHRHDATRFERYLGARLNELLPVVTWYGPEQAMRLDEGAFDRAHAGAHKEADTRRARWLRGARDDRALAGRLLREGILHLERELTAVDTELREGRVVPVAHPFLDASSDAIAYVAAHGEFLDRASTDDVLVRFSRPEVERFTTVSAYRDHVEDVFDALLFGSSSLDPASLSGEIRARRVWDLAQRAARLGPRTHARLGAWLDDATTLAAQARAGTHVDVGSLREGLRDRLGDRADAVLRNGDPEAPDALDTSLLAAGIEATCPTVARSLDVGSFARLLAEAPEHLRRATLPERARSLLGRLDEPALEDAARFDDVLARATATDPEVEELGLRALDWPKDLASLRFRASAAFELVTLDHDVLADGPDAPGRPFAALVGRARHELSVVPVPTGFAPAWRRLARRASRGDVLLRHVGTALRISPPRARALLAALADAGAIGALAALPSA